MIAPCGIGWRWIKVRIINAAVALSFLAVMGYLLGVVMLGMLTAGGF